MKVKCLECLYRDFVVIYISCRCNGLIYFYDCSFVVSEVSNPVLDRQIPTVWSLQGANKRKKKQLNKKIINKIYN